MGRITTLQFVELHDGEYIDDDGKWGPTCMDAWRRYVKEVADVEQGPLVSGAADVFYKYNVTAWKRIIRTKDNFPLLGDPIVWKRSPKRTAGHIAICIEADKDRLIKVFEQNPGPCHIGSYDSYEGVLGWFRLIEKPVEPVPDNARFEATIKALEDDVAEAVRKFRARIGEDCG